jgi:hypothetical protein
MNADENVEIDLGNKRCKQRLSSFLKQPTDGTTRCAQLQVSIGGGGNPLDVVIACYQAGMTRLQITKR